MQVAVEVVEEAVDARLACVAREEAEEEDAAEGVGVGLGRAEAEDLEMRPAWVRR